MFAIRLCKSLYVCMIFARSAVLPGLAPMCSRLRTKQACKRV